MTGDEKEIDLSVFYKLLDPKNKFKESPEEIYEQRKEALKYDLKRLTMAERDKKRPKGFQV